MENTIGERMKRVRLDKGVTLAELAPVIGISPPALSNYERGERVPDGKALIKLAKYFDCTTDYLLGLSDAKNSADANQIEEAANELSTAIGKADETVRKLIVDAAQWIQVSCSMLEPMPKMRKALISALDGIVTNLTKIVWLPSLMEREIKRAGDISIEAKEALARKYVSLLEQQHNDNSNELDVFNTAMGVFLDTYFKQVDVELPKRDSVTTQIKFCYEDGKYWVEEIGDTQIPPSTPPTED